MKRSVFTLVFIVALVSLIPASIAFGKGQPSVEVCHITGEADFGNGPVPVGQAISIAQGALDSHISHGDLETFVFLTLPNGREVCSVAGAGGGAPKAGSPGNGQPSVDVCHVTGIADFGTGPLPVGHVITIAQPAYDAHIAHGDPETFGLLTLPGGREGCSIDSDSDGIPDAVDACPDEGDLGSGVDPDGCPIIPPDLSLEGFCVPDLAFPRVVISNSGGPMTESAAYNVDFEDGTSLSGDFILGAGEIIDLDFSNLHGWLFNFSVSGYPGLNTLVENCLDPVIQQIVIQAFEEFFTTGPFSDPENPYQHHVGNFIFGINIQGMSYENTYASTMSIDGGYLSTAYVTGIEIDVFAECYTLSCLYMSSLATISIDSLEFSVDWYWDADLTSIISNQYVSISNVTSEWENEFMGLLLGPFVDVIITLEMEWYLLEDLDSSFGNSILPFLVD